MRIEKHLSITMAYTHDSDANADALAHSHSAQRMIERALSGVDLGRNLRAGERVEDKLAPSVAAVDPLEVMMIALANQFSNRKRGMVGTLKPDLTDAASRPAKVIVDDRVIDPASNRFRVRLERPNANEQLRPRLRCKVALESDTIPQQHSSGVRRAATCAAAAMAR